MNVFASLAGKLNSSALPQATVTRFAAVGVVLSVLAVLGLITYLKRWKWLWGSG